MTPYALVVPCLATFLACSTDALDNTGSQQGMLQAGTHGVLTQAEWRTYAMDRKYIRSLTKPDVPIRLNMADDKQYRFARTRLKLVGKTPENSPYLFEAIEARRKEHLAMGVTQGLLPGAFYTAENEGGIKEMHYMAAATVGTAQDPDLGQAAASSTVPGGSLFTSVDAAFYDAGDNLLGEIGYKEEYGAGLNTTAVSNADLSQAVVGHYIQDSYKTEETEEGYQDSYIFTETGAIGATNRPAAPEGLLLLPVAPRDLDGDQEILVCLSRNHGDCDYNLLGTWQVKMPLQGSILITSAHSIRQADIDQVKADLAANPASTTYGHLKLILGFKGGGCDVKADGALYASMKQVWDKITVSTDGKTLSWDLSGANSAFFDEGCQQIGNAVTLNLRLSIPVRDAGGLKVAYDVTLTNDDTITTRVHDYGPIRMVNSCLAEGTMIQLADGREAAIESVATGDRTANPYHTDEHALTIVDKAVGTEPLPMVRVEDEAGRSILMTETHPIQTPDRGMVPIKYIREGDVVMTTAGPTKLVRVAREQYDGKVYNLKVGSQSEKASLGKDQTVVYANGFVVGDLQIQSDYDALELVKQEGNVIDSLPSRWHRDYLMSTLGKKMRFTM